MTLFRLSLRQARVLGTSVDYKWATTFYYDTSDALTAAEDGVQMWVDYLRDAARDDVFAYEVYATDLAPATDNFAVVPVPAANAYGTLDSANDSHYHRDICIAVTLAVAASRPSRKFWRPGLGEADFGVDGHLNAPALVSAIGDAFAALLGFYTGLKDPDGQDFLGGVNMKESNRRIRKSQFVDLPALPAV